MSQFYALKVHGIEHNTQQSVLVTLEVPQALEDKFKYKSGQYLTFRYIYKGEELRRSYSICVGEQSKFLKVGVKKVENGAFSSYVNDTLSIGEALEVMAPMGRFTLEDGNKNQLLMIAAGSGITPIISHIETVFDRDYNAEITLIYGNKTPNSTMFRERIEELKNEHMDRFTVVHVLSTSPQDIALFSGRISREKCADILQHWVCKTEFDQALICGPEEMVMNVRQALHCVGMAGDQIKYELFATTKRNSAPAIIEGEADLDVALTIILDGTAHQLSMNKNESVLDVARRSNLDVPFSCTAGICSTCRCKILEGSAQMQANHVLEDDEVARSYALSCQLIPNDKKLVISYDEGH